MKIQENYFYRLDDSKDVKVIWKKYDKANILEIGIEYPTTIVDLDRFSGIPLTEDWLLTFGFELKNNNNYFNAIKYGIWHNKQKREPYQIGFYCAISDVKLDYVHELQNLYFALTGEELVVSDSVS